MPEQARRRRSEPVPASEPAVAQPHQAGAGNSARLEQLRGQGALNTPTTAQQAPSAQPAPVDELALGRVIAMVLARVPAELQAHAETGVPAILSSAAYGNVRNGDQVAYLLATAEHESRFGKPKFSRSEPLVEDHNPYKHQTITTPARRGRPERTEDRWSATPHAGRRAPVTADNEKDLDTQYWDAAYGGRLGNRRGTEDAAQFKGRGYAQVTGRTNYEGRSRDLNNQGAFYRHDGKVQGGKGGPRPIDLAANPQHVNESPELAAELLVMGSRDGSYTGKSLDDYIPAGEQPDFVNARKVINGDTAENGEAIATKARNYATVLKSAWPSVFAVRGQGPR